MADLSELRLALLAEVIVRVGLNLQPGQPLLITEPYELQGVHPEAGSLVEAIRSLAVDHEVTVISADPVRLRTLVEADDRRAYETLVHGHVGRMEQHLARGGALLFLLGSQPQFLAGLPAERLAHFDRIKWRHLGPVIQRLIRGASQWTLVPAPSSAWADAAFADLAAVDRLPALWQTVLEALRVERWNPASGQVQSASGLLRQGYGAHAKPQEPAIALATAGGRAPPIELWSTHLAELARRRDELNAARHRRIRYVGPGTDLTLELPRSHAWCTAQLVSKAGVPFVVNLPTEEVFTAPHKNSARGTLRVARPVVHGGVVIDGIELEFKAGRVVTSRARTGQDALRHLLATDRGACRIGEVAMVAHIPRWASVSIPTPVADGEIGDHPACRLFHHTLLDENAANHLALGDAYPFCSRALLPLALNSSQVHLDLPLDATMELC